MKKLKLMAVLTGLVSLSLLSGAPSAQATGLSFVTADVFEKSQPVAPGIYGFEARGGRQGRADWEIGVGTQTSNPGTFNQGEFNWVSADTWHNFFMEWTSSSVKTTIGSQMVSYDANWEIGNALEILVKGDAKLELNNLDGQAFAQSFGPGTYFIAGNSLTDGWTMSGRIAMTNGGGSRHSVLITTGNAEIEEESVPEPSIILGSLVLGAMGFAAKRKQMDSAESSDA